MTPSKRRTRELAFELSIQFVVLVVGVLLALAVDQWRDARANKRLADAALQSIRRELTQNRATLRARLPYHKALLDSVLADVNAHVTEGSHGLIIKPGERLRSPQSMGFHRGFALSPTLSDNAWRTAIAANVLTLLDYPTTTVLSDAYAKQAEVGDAEDELSTQFPLVLGGYFLGEEALKAALVTQAGLGDLVLRERESLARDDSALVHLRGGEPARAPSADPGAKRP